MSAPAASTTSVCHCWCIMMHVQIQPMRLPFLQHSSKCKLLPYAVMYKGSMIKCIILECSSIKCHQHICAHAWWDSTIFGGLCVGAKTSCVCTKRVHCVSSSRAVLYLCSVLSLCLLCGVYARAGSYWSASSRHSHSSCHMAYTHI